MNEPEINEVVVERSVSVPAQRAYDAWADAGALSCWFTTNAEQDLRVGGRYSNGDGDVGEFLEIEPGSRIRFTWEQPKAAPGTEVSVEFRPEAPDVATVRIVHSLLVPADVAGMQDGWEWALDSLKSYLETGQPIRYNDWLSRKEMGV